MASSRGALIQQDTIDLLVQVNGKLRAKMKVPADISQEQAVDLALNLPEIKKWLDGQPIKKTIYISGRLLNFVV